MSTEEKPLEYRFSGYRLDLKKRTFHAPDGSLLPLSYRAFDTLAVFAAHSGQTLSKAMLMKAVWPGQVVDDNNLSQAIVNLRKALDDHSREGNRFIVTLPGKGYCFTADVETSFQQDSAKSLLPETRKLLLRWAPPAALLASILLVVLAYSRSERPEPAGEATAELDSKVLAQASLQPSEPNAELQLPASIPNSIAVLPFTNLANPGSDSENPLFAIALHDAIINQLAKVSSLNVIARNSVVSLARQGMDPQEMSRVLRVESVMTGTLLVAGSKARINLQLINPSTGVSFWSGTFEADTDNLSDMISIQSDIALQVASRLEAEIQQSEREEITAIPTESFDAYKYQQAAKLALYRQNHHQNWSLSRLAIEHDPNYYDALATFAAANIVAVSAPLKGFSGQDHANLVLETAEKMIRIAPDNSQGHSLRAMALGTRKEWQDVGKSIDSLLAMNTPLDKLSHIAMLLLSFGDFETAIRIYQEHLLTEPLDHFGRGFLMTALELTGQREQAREQYNTGEQLYPQWWGDNVNILLSLGRGEALQDVEELEGMSPALKQLLATAADPVAVRNAVTAYRDTPYKIPAEALYYAALAASIGEQQTALALMEATVEDAWTSLFWFWLPVFDEIRFEPGFHALLNKSGIIDYWNSHGWADVCQPTSSSFVCDWRAYP